MVNHKKALEFLWKGICTITVQEGTKNSTNKRIEFDESVLHENKPCKLSFKTITTTTEGVAAGVSQVAVLFMSNEFEVPPGSKITITQNGKTTDYERSGEPAIYSHHQEIPLALFKGWA